MVEVQLDVPPVVGAVLLAVPGDVEVQCHLKEVGQEVGQGAGAWKVEPWPRERHVPAVVVGDTWEEMPVEAQAELVEEQNCGLNLDWLGLGSPPA